MFIIFSPLALINISNDSIIISFQQYHSNWNCSFSFCYIILLAKTVMRASRRWSKIPRRFLFISVILQYLILHKLICFNLLFIIITSISSFYYSYQISSITKSSCFFNMFKFFFISNVAKFSLANQSIILFGSLIDFRIYYQQICTMIAIAFT